MLDGIVHVPSITLNNIPLFQPYRLVHDTNSCILCGRGRGRNANPRDKCECFSMTFCEECVEDDE